MNRYSHSIALVCAMMLAPGHASARTGDAGHPLYRAASAQAAPASESQAELVGLDASNKPLSLVMREIHARSGAEIRLPETLSGDVIVRSVRGGTWQSFVEHALEGYNYSAVWGNRGQPLRVTVYSRNQNADGLVATDAATKASVGEDLLIYQSPAPALPQKYQGLDPASVNPVSLPVERMKEMALGEKVSLNLPCGQFAVVYDKHFQNESGELTWAGYLETAGQAYRVIITLGSEGSRGQVVTPEGTYNLDVVEGRTWLVDANAPVGA